MGRGLLASWTAVLLGVLLPCLAVRPSQEILWPLEVAGSEHLLVTAKGRDDAKEFHTAGASVLEAQQAVADGEADASVTEKSWDDYWLATSEVYPNCSLQTEGSFSVDEPLHVNDSCIWHANGVQVTVKQPMKFHGSLVLQGELHIIGAAALDGSCMRVLGNLSVLGTHVTFTGCENTNWDNDEAGSGGGVHVGGDFRLLRSTAAFFRCKAKVGGGANVRGHFEQRNSIANFEGCSARGYGGGAYVQGRFEQRNSSANFEGCRAGYEGGELLADSFARMHGGGLYAESFTQMQGSAAHFTNLIAYRGGGLYVESFTQMQGSAAHFTNCIANYDGGGLMAKSFIQMQNSSAQFENCTAEYGGGARVYDVFSQVNASATFRGCRADDEGGGLNALSFDQDQGAVAEFANCSAKNNGGGVWTELFQQEETASAEFGNCSAKHGGGLYPEELLFGSGSGVFRTCHAEEGGGVYVPEDCSVNHSGSLVFEASSALTEGGGIYFRPPTGVFKTLVFTRCEAHTLAAALAAATSGVEVDIKDLALLDVGASNVKDMTVAGSLTVGTAHLRTRFKFGTYISAESLMLAEEIDCTGATSCAFYADTVQTPGLRCPVGTGFVPHHRLHEFGCLVCDPGNTQTINGTNRSCSQCPDGARECFAGHLVMERGMMVQNDFVNQTLHCPNQAACPGGRLPQSPDGKAMCVDGYEGQGCTSCSVGYAIADSSVLTCTPCSDQPRTQAVQWALLLAQRSLVFAVASASASKAGSVKQSSIYLNQLMAFATVASAVMNAVLQTGTAQGMKTQAASLFFDATLSVAETSSGQGSFGSTQCLLSYVHSESLRNAHLLDIAIAVALMLIVHSRAGVVAGLNCFLPIIAAGFGKYLVCFRLEPDRGAGLDGLHCPFLPDESTLVGSVKVLGGLVLCLAAALCTWLHLSRSTETPPPPHFVVLTSKYQPQYALFETERLLRKTLIALIGAVLPIAASPALQMGCLGVVVVSSLILYVFCQPYHTQSWNRSEISLLCVANYMILIVSALLANEFHWAHSERTQQAIVVTAVLCAAVTSTVMGWFVVTELLKERKAAPA